MRTILFTFLAFLLTDTQAQPPVKSALQPAAMQEDFNYLRRMLEETHPGLYMHHTREAMQYKMDSLGQQLNQPLPFLEFYKKIAYLIAEVRCEHTYCNYGEGFGDLVKKAKLLPLQLYFLSGKAYVTVNCTNEKDIQLGDELLSINNYPIDSIRQVLYRYLPSDGYMVSSKDQQLSGMAFNIWYYLFIEQAGAYSATIRSKEGKIINKRWKKGVTIEEANKQAVKNPVNKRILELDKENQEIRKQALRFKWLPEKNMAIMTVQSFSVDKEKFVSTIGRFFDSLAKLNPGRLILDISNNGGGDEELAAELLSYFITQPAKLIENEYLITDSDAHFAISNAPEDFKKNKYEFITPLANGRSEAKITKYSQELKTMQPKPNRYTGKVYLYVNGVTSSAASTFAAVMKSKGLALIVGEETAGSFAGGGTTNGLELVLPNSRITAHTSIVYQVFATKGGDGNRGVIPDYPYLPTFEVLVGKAAGWKEYIIGLADKGL